MALEDIITAKEYSLRDILQSKKYTVDYFQREYSWTAENINQLVYDLTNAFYEKYKEGDTSDSIDNYNTYYMGPIVLYDNGVSSSIIDGQQRITSLTLLLIYLKRLSADVEETLIYSKVRDKKSYNIIIPEREKCLDCLFNNGSYDVSDDDDPSVINMVRRYSDIEASFPDELRGEALNIFTYWLEEKVILVKITTNSDKNAYMVFETMNDRGLSLTSTDMLKGFILSKYTDIRARRDCEQKWKANCQKLQSYGKNVDNQFFQAWLRSQFANTIRPSKAGSINQDFENIGVRFHYWFRENYESGLLKAAINNDIESFMDDNYAFYLKWFLKIKEAESNFTTGLEHVYYASYWGIAESLKYPLYLAPLSLTDSDDTCLEKIDLVAKFVDVFCVGRSTNFKLFSASSLRYTMSSLVKEIRNKSADDIRPILQKEIDDNSYTFDNLDKFRLHQKNYFFVKYYLARITSFVEVSCGMPNNFVSYITNPDCKPFEVEHIWADKIEYHQDEFVQKDEFEEWRNKIGGLILLPNGSNQSYGGLDYELKMPHYLKENILAKSLCSETYEHNPNFVNFKNSSGLPFKSYNEFKKKDLLERVGLYRKISEIIWGRL